MRNGRVALRGMRKMVFLRVSFLLSLLAIGLASAAFVADRYASSAMDLLDDPQTEYRDIVDINDENLGVYREATESYEKAVLLAPLNAEYAASLGDLYHRVDIWRNTMSAMGERVDDSFALSTDSGKNAVGYMRRAECLDPADPDHRLALGKLYADEGNREAAVEETMHAADAYPINAPRRYAVVMQLLLMGERKLAREQAAVVASIDDSYRLDDENAMTASIREQRPPGYESDLVGSYLYKALEVIWNTSGKDQKAVLASVPDNADALEVARLFFMNKGVGEGNASQGAQEQ